MDYERKELVDWVRGIYQNLDEADKQDALRFFPELRESKDERMMKNIRLALLSVEDAFWRTHGLTAKEAISYIEKLKEQKHPDGCFTCDEYKKGYEEGRRNGFTAGYNKAMKEIEQKEQKPWKVGANAYFTPEQKPAWSEEDEQYLLICKNALSKYQRSDQWDANIISNWLDEKLKSLRPQLNPKWSEEDDEIRKALIAFLEINTGYFSCNGFTKDDIIQWLKSHCSQPKVEWSEEDEKNLGQVISGKYLPLGLREWFCGLPERFPFRPSCKPNEEQMKALEECGECKRCIKELREQLKKS